MIRSRGAAVAVLCLALVSTGCVGFLTGSDSLSFAANATAVDESALEEADYQQYRSDSQVRTENFSVAGQTREVEVTNEIRGYNRSLDLGPLGQRDLARFITYTTPAVEIAGQTFNPVADWSNRQIVRRLSSSYDDVSDVQFEENRTVAALGDARTVSTFSGESTVAGQDVDVSIHVTKFRHGDDFVIAVAVHPQRIDEEGRIDTLLRGLEHE